jgi:acetyl esterase/lipase
MFPGKFDPMDRPKIQIPDADVSYVKRKYLDIPYASLSPAQKLDIYLPDTGDGPFPVILQIHGGGFEFGDKRDIHLLPFLEGIERGYAVVSINYRLSWEARFPAAVEDVKAAARWIRANQGQFHLNGERITACGGSAGGNLAAMLGVTGKTREFDNPALGNIECSSAVQAVVDWFGPIDFLAMDSQLMESGLGPVDHSGPHSPEARYLGAEITTIKDQAARSNPTTYIHPDIPPFFIQHGRADNLVPVQQSINLAKALKKAAPGDRVILEILENAGHGDPQFETVENMDRVFAFLNLCFK